MSPLLRQELDSFTFLAGHYLAVLYLDFHEFSASLALDFALVVPVCVVAEMEDSSAFFVQAEHVNHVNLPPPSVFAHLGLLCILLRLR